MPIVAAAAALLEMRGVVPLLLPIVIRTLALPVPAAFVAVMGTSVLDVAVGVPETMPVATSSVSPDGIAVAENEAGALLAVIA